MMMYFKHTLAFARLSIYGLLCIAAVLTLTFFASPAHAAVSLDGAGGPILVVKGTGNPFTGYYGEILRAEGFNSFKALNLSQVNATVLAQYNVVILGDISLTAAQVTMFTNWVNGGGNLIAMSPDKKLAALLGLTDAASTRSNAYLLVNTANDPGKGIVDQTIQYHGSADLYTLSGATAVATLYSSATQSTQNPAVTLRSVGSNGGQAAAFTFDLARSIVQTRQGNPAWSGQERDGQAPIRPNDLFYPDWVNLNKAAIPQADELQRLLANMIIHMNIDVKPLPRFWYFPNMEKAVLLMTGDDHGTAAGTQTTFNSLIAQSPAGCSVADWECLRATSWLYTSSPLTNAQALSYHNQGFEIGVHVNTNCANWTAATLPGFFTNDLAAFAAKYTSIPAQKTSRTHCIAWSDYATQPKVELQNGIRLDENYYYWPAEWVQNRPGFFTGSGIPMRFADTNGALIDVYQAPTHLVNENGVSYPSGINAVLDRALGVEGYYGVFGTHYDHSDSFDQQLISSSVSRGVPIITAQQLLTWLDAKNNSTFGTSTWNGTTLSFPMTVDAGARNLFAMLPKKFGTRELTGVTINGVAVPFTLETIKGLEYGVFKAASGSVVAAYGADTTPPSVTSIVPASGATGVSTTSNILITFSEAMTASSIGTSTIELRNPANSLVSRVVTYNATNRTATVNPSANLQPNTTYTVQVRGGTSDPRVRDAAGNRMTTLVTSTFTTAPAGLSAPVSFWSTSSTPGTPAFNDPTAVTLGLGFRSSVSGNVTGIRFYKGAGNTGTHVGALWSSAGAPLATGTFTGETATGWQTLMFTSPVAITANTEYVVSYHAPAGNYAADANYFVSDLVQGVLTAPGGGNGRFVYGSSSAFPNQSFQSTNYWVDVLFQQ